MAQCDIDLSEKRFQGFSWGVEPDGLVILLRPQCIVGAESMDEDERARFTAIAELDWIRAKRNTAIGQSFIASQRVRRNAAHGIPIPGHPGEWIIYMGDKEGKDIDGNTKIPIVILYGNGKVLCIEDGETILRLAFKNDKHRRLWCDEDTEYYSRFDFISETENKNKEKEKCVWCSKDLANGDHHHEKEALSAREIIAHLLT